MKPEAQDSDSTIHKIGLLLKEKIDKGETGIKAISLEATEMGRHLYEKYGFVKMNDEMELR